MIRNPLTPEPGEPIIIICLPTTEHKNLDTATIGQRMECGHKIWVAPTTRKMLLLCPPPQTRLVCRECAAAAIDREAAKGESVTFALLPGMLEEACEQLKRNAAAKNN